MGPQQDTAVPNAFIAEKLREVADLLDQQAATAFRVRAYREAAAFVDAMAEPLGDVYAKSGRSGLEDLPTIGSSIAAAIAELLDTGRLGLLGRLRGSADPEALFQTVPMIGPTLAHAIHDTLHIETLEALEAAAADGRLLAVDGIGQRRLDSLRHSLNEMLARRRPPRPHDGVAEPSVSDILAVDLAYRDNAYTFPTIRPRRFNATGERRIPIMHTEAGAWQYTALFSNTASAHRFDRTRDWVVIYFERDGGPDGQATVVTQHGGPLDGRRVVRGREAECVRYYAS